MPQARVRWCRPRLNVTLNCGDTFGDNRGDNAGLVTEMSYIRSNLCAVVAEWPKAAVC